MCGMLLVLAGLIVHTIVRRFQEFDHSLRILTRELKGPSAAPASFQAGER